MSFLGLELGSGNGLSSHVFWKGLLCGIGVLLPVWVYIRTKDLRMDSFEYTKFVLVRARFIIAGYWILGILISPLSFLNVTLICLIAIVVSWLLVKGLVQLGINN